MSAYRRLLQHPLWQKKRLEVFERDGFRCVACGSARKTLQVHHIRYTGNPWEADIGDMQTLCCVCHVMLPLHPKGGVYWVHSDEMGTGMNWVHCPKCGYQDLKDKGSFERCNSCGCRISGMIDIPVWEGGAS